MKINIHIVKDSDLIYVGYIEEEYFNADKCWDMCNWKHWLKEAPDGLHANISSCSHGICFTNPETNEIWLAKSIGWLVGNRNEIIDYVNQNKDELIWL